MAVDFALVLYDVKYPEEQDNVIQWEYPTHSLSRVLTDMQALWTEYSVK